MLHDLRSPAQSLTLIADLMSDPATEVEEILRESCAHLAHSLELLTRLVIPPPPPDTGPIALSGPLGFLEELHRAARTRTRLEIAAEPSLPAAVGVERHLEHVLLNLLLNAADALPRQNGVIRVTATRAGDRIEVAMADNGPGVPPTLADQLFRSRVTSRVDAPLAGYGLLVASELLRLSAGTLRHVPTADPGTRFVISLPVWPPAVPRPS